MKNNMWEKSKQHQSVTQNATQPSLMKGWDPETFDKKGGFSNKVTADLLRALQSLLFPFLRIF